MKNKWFILLLVFVFSCKEEQIQDYSLYYKMDKVVFTEYKLRPRKKVIIPFSFNQIYDPFIKTKKGFNNKATYEKGKWRGIKITVLDTIITSMTVTGRVSKRKKIAQAFPVIIENITKKTNVTVPLHRGCANIIQEAQNNKGEWVAIENFTNEKIGGFYYKIYPKQYVYTKTPIYYGTDTTSFRISMALDDTTYYSNTYESTIQKWMLRK